MGLGSLNRGLSKLGMGREPKIVVRAEDDDLLTVDYGDGLAGPLDGFQPPVQGLRHELIVLLLQELSGISHL